MKDILTSAQCRQARKLLGWPMRDLRAKSKISVDTISRLERGVGPFYYRTLRDLRAAFEAAGINFEKSQVRLRKNDGKNSN
jgi:transcriptional regulator with XRE-family HTH domain